MESGCLPTPRKKMLTLRVQCQLQPPFASSALSPSYSMQLWPKRYNRKPDRSFPGDIFLPTCLRLVGVIFGTRAATVGPQGAEPKDQASTLASVEGKDGKKLGPREIYEAKLRNLWSQTLHSFLYKIIFPPCLNPFIWAFPYLQLNILTNSKGVSFYIIEVNHIRWGFIFLGNTLIQLKAPGIF